MTSAQLALLRAFLAPRGQRGLIWLTWFVQVGMSVVVLAALVGLGLTIALWPSLLLSKTVTSDFGAIIGGTFGSSLVAYLQMWNVMSRLESWIASDAPALALALRDSIAAGDAQVAPTVETEAKTFFDSDMSLAPTPYDNLAAPAATDTGDDLTLAIPQQFTASGFLFYALGGTFLAILVFTVLVMLLAPNGPSLLATSQSLQVFLAIFGGGGALLVIVLLAFGLAQSRRRARQRQGFAVGMDERGLTWRQPIGRAQRMQIAWHDITGLARFSYKPTRKPEHIVYLLLTREQTLLWEEPSTALDGAPGSDVDTAGSQQQDSRRLVSAVTLHTRLPLRDLTATVAAFKSDSSGSTKPFMQRAYHAAILENNVELAEKFWRALHPKGRLPHRLQQLLTSSGSVPRYTGLTVLSAEPSVTLNGEPTYAARMQAPLRIINERLRQERSELLAVSEKLLLYYPTEATPNTPRAFRAHLACERARRGLGRALRWAEFATIIALIVAVVVFWFQEQSVNAMIRAIPQQMTAQSQDYYDPLTMADSDWCIGAPTKDSTPYYEFANGSYKLGDTVTTNGAACGAITEFGDSAISVRVSITIAHPNAQTQGAMAGILFDERGDYQTYAMFGVDMSGDWALYRYNGAAAPNDQWSGADYGTSAAIHTGAGAVNTLLLVRHGPLYLAYANGTLVERYYDSFINGAIIGSVNVPRIFSPGGNCGVYIAANGIVGHFRDFAIYELPPTLAQVPLSQNLPFWFV